MSERYDVILIGTGAGGGTLLHRLASSGKSILVLERGDWLRREPQNWDSKAVFLDERYKAREQWLDRHGKTFAPGIHYWVGGNTKVYGAALLRFRERDFGELRHHGGVSPAWPITYADLEPYYTEAEWLYDVHGARGEDPTEPPASRPYKWRPVRHEPRVQELSDGMRCLGLRPFHLPLGVRLDEDDHRKSACVRCPTCDGFPCLVGAKADAETTCVAPALAHPDVTLLTNARVVKLETSASGREVARVVADVGGRQQTFRGDVVVVACGAINSAALLLASASDRHPRGLGNSSDVVGRFYMCHNNSAVLALSLTPNPTVFQKTLAVNDFYFGAEDFEFPLGHIQMLGKSDRVMLATGAPAFAPGVALEAMARRSLDFWLTSEDLPDPENRVTLAEGGRIQLSYRENNLEGHTRLRKKLKWMLEHLGCESHLLPQHLYMNKKIPLAGTAHQCGTVRMGTEPRTSALDPDCRMHDLDNLYVVDGSCFVSSTGVNPALTIMANALRVGDHLLQRLGARAPAVAHA